MRAPENADQAYFDGRNDERLDNRIEAFAAIRRAAYQARMFDKVAAMQPFGIVDTRNLEAAGAAMGIRRAIRRAIGSEKT